MGRPVGRRIATWWRGLSIPARFRIYTRVTLQVSLVVVAASLSVTVAANGSGPWPVLGIVAVVVACSLAVETQPEFASRSAPRRPAAMLYLAALVQAAIWAAAAVAGTVGDTDNPSLGIVLVFAAMGVLVTLAPSVRRPWPAAVGIGLVSGALLSDSFGSRAVGAMWVVLLAVIVLATIQLTRWSLRVVDDLERARHAEAQLQVAQERLAFSRDLHDVVGRAFTTIALKSELATKLARQHEVERACSEMDEVNALAISSMDEMRTLVRGYRTPDLASEVAGARSLLAAAGCTLEVQGDHAAVPPAFHEVAAWLVREGTTNIVRHTSASTAGLTLGSSGMALVNDGASESRGEQSGLRGLRERLAAAGADLEVTASGDTFSLEARWRS